MAVKRRLELPRNAYETPSEIVEIRGVSMFKELINHKVKVVYRDGQNINAIKGTLISVDKNLIRIKTIMNRDFYISISTIQRINERSDN